MLLTFRSFGQRVGQAFQPADSLERLSHIRFAPVEKRTRKVSAIALQRALHP